MARNFKAKKIDPSLNWNFAKIINVEDSKLVFQILKKKEQGNISINNLKWAIKKKKTIYDSFKINDIIFVHKNKNKNGVLNNIQK